MKKKRIPINDATTYSPTQRSKKVVYPITFIYVWTTFEQQVKDLYASP